jgi:hypothetical protein
MPASGKSHILISLLRNILVAECLLSVVEEHGIIYNEKIFNLYYSLTRCSPQFPCTIGIHQQLSLH